MLTSQQIAEGIKEHKFELPRLQKLFRYYVGEHDILNRKLPDPTKPNNRIVTGYPSLIVDTVTGYMGYHQISYTSTDDNQEYMTKINDTYELNDEADINAEIIKEMAIYGRTYEVYWVDPDGNIRFKNYDPIKMYVKRDGRGNVKYGFRYWEEKINNRKVTKVEAFTKNGVYYYTSEGQGRGRFVEDPEEASVEHFFGEVPITVYKNNEEEKGDFEKFIPAVSGQDKNLSDSQNELEAFANAYLKLKGYEGTTWDDVEKMRQNGTLLLGKDGEDADFLTKNLNPEYQQKLFENIDYIIHSQSGTPKLASESFSSNLSGVAIGFKLFPLETKCAMKERKITKALRNRLKLITRIYNLKDGIEYNPLTIRLKWTRNLPTNNTEVTDQIVKLWDKADRETLLSMHSGIIDAAQSMKKNREQQLEDGLGELKQGILQRNNLNE